MRVADAAAAVLRLRQVGVDDLREEAIRPVRMRAGAAGVDFLHLLPDSLAVLEHRHFEAGDAQTGTVEDVLGVVQERDGVVIAADQQNLSVELAKRSSAEPLPNAKSHGCSEIR